MSLPTPTLWNRWWTLTVIAAGFTILMLILEGLGVLHDWGVVLSGIGVVLTIVGSAQASTRSSVTGVTHALHNIHDTLSHSLKVQHQIRDLLDRRH
ncbi:MAG: hypothetical protein C5B54_05740 [Acidobacteria bacterium]|nr:MAG: hypothetical protein C5B54_05740 [Acidobacteriota bacterium]